MVAEELDLIERAFSRGCVEPKRTEDPLIEAMGRALCAVSARDAQWSSSTAATVR
jgi:hypothetical protein